MHPRVDPRRDWNKPTPCSEWDVYALVNHVVVGGWRYGRVLQGGSLEFVATRGDMVLGSDPRGEWDRARQFSERTRSPSPARWSGARASWSGR